MTQDRGQRTEDRRRRAENAAIIGLPSSAVRLPSCVAVLALLSLALAGGCRNRALEQAQQEAREAKTAAKRMEYSLKTAAEEIATVKAELSTVRQDRDELQKRVDQLTHERDQAATFAQEAQEAISNLAMQESGHKSVTAALEKQIAELKILVDDQHKLIEQLKGAAAGPAATAAQATDKPVTPDPNERL